MSVLVVDDHAANATMTQRMLQAGGFEQIRTLTDPTLVESIVDHQRPDLILLDLHMDGMDGFEVMAVLAKLWKDELAPPIVVVSGDATQATLRRALNYGAVDYILKPFDRTELVLRARNQLSLRQRSLLLERQRRALEVDLERERLEAVERLVHIVQARDPAGADRMSRVEELAAEIDRLLGAQDADATQLGRAARLHDIGMIAVPDWIRAGEEPLAPEDRQVLQSHTLTGAAILAGSRSPLLLMAEEIARCHHEHWDGSGYPAGLGGLAIPRAARIVAIADAFDVVCHRPGPDRSGADQAVEEIRAGRGSRFDPDVVELFIESRRVLNV